MVVRRRVGIDALAMPWPIARVEIRCRCLTSTAAAIAVEIAVGDAVVENERDLPGPIARGFSEGLARSSGVAGRGRLLPTGEFELETDLGLWTYLVTAIVGVALPSEPVGAGATWETSSQFHLDPTINVVTQYVLASVTGSVVELRFRSEGTARAFSSEPRRDDGRKAEAVRSAWSIAGELTRSLGEIVADRFRQETRAEQIVLGGQGKRLSRQDFWFHEALSCHGEISAG